MWKVPIYQLTLDYERYVPGELLTYVYVDPQTWKSKGEGQHAYYTQWRSTEELEDEIDRDLDKMSSHV